ncbi:MAG: ATP-binding protein [Microthrixaceae bacterium]
MIVDFASDNPFYEDPAIRSHFVGRERELRVVKARVESVARHGKSHSISVPGFTGFGKSSFLTYICSEARTQGLCFAFVELGKPRSGDQLAKDQLLEIFDGAIWGIESWSKSNGRDVDILLDDRCERILDTCRQFDRRLTNGDFVQLMDFILKKVILEDATGFALVLDQAENLEPETMQSLRSALARSKCLLLALGWRVPRDTRHKTPVEELFRANMDNLAVRARADDGIFVKFTETTLAMKQFDSLDEARQCIRVRLGDDEGGRFPEHIIDAIAVASARQPRRIVQLCHHVYEAASLSGQFEISDDDLRMAMRIEMMNEWQALEQEIEDLTETGRILLSKIIDCGQSTDLPAVLRRLDSDRPVDQTWLAEVEDDLLKMTKSCDALDYSAETQRITFRRAATYVLMKFMIELYV